MGKMKLWGIASGVAMAEMLLASLMFMFMGDAEFMVEILGIVSFLIGQDLIITYLFSLHMEKKDIAGYRKKSLKTLPPLESKVLLFGTLAIVVIVFMSKVDVMVMLLSVIGFRAWMEYLFYHNVGR